MSRDKKTGARANCPLCHGTGRVKRNKGKDADGNTVYHSTKCMCHVQGPKWGNRYRGTK